VDAGSVLGLQQLRTPFLDDLSAAESRCRSRRRVPRRRSRGVGTRNRRTQSVGHEMSRRYILEHPVDDDDDDEDDDFDEDDDGDEDDDEDEDAPETWQVCG